MMHDLFTRGIDPKTNKLRPKYEYAPELYKETELGFIPKEWKVKKMAECNNVILSNVDKKNYLNESPVFIMQLS